MEKHGKTSKSIELHIRSKKRLAEWIKVRIFAL